MFKKIFNIDMKFNIDIKLYTFFYKQICTHTYDFIYFYEINTKLHF